IASCPSGSLGFFDVLLRLFVRFLDFRLGVCIRLKFMNRLLQFFGRAICHFVLEIPEWDIQIVRNTDSGHKFLKLYKSLGRHMWVGILGKHCLELVSQLGVEGNLCMWISTRTVHGSSCGTSGRKVAASVWAYWAVGPLSEGGCSSKRD